MSEQGNDKTPTESLDPEDALGSIGISRRRARVRGPDDSSLATYDLPRSRVRKRPPPPT